MDQKEQRNEQGLPVERDRQIQLVVNRPESDETTIDLGNVFRTMKNRRRLFAWVLVLCLLVGVTAPLLLYQFTKPMLTVSSVVSLRYETPKKVKVTDEDGKETWEVPENPEYEMVSDLSAPDGEDLDLNQITSSYVLQSALDGMTLSQPVTAANLRSNITITTVLTEESSRTKEILQGLAEAKNTEAYTRLEEAEMKYKNQFVVSLTNGFGDEEARTKMELTDEELKMLLDRVLTEYNSYLVRTYADLKLPEDRFTAIDVRELDAADSLDEIVAGLDALREYGEKKSDSVLDYRSWQTGRTLRDWLESAELFREIGVNGLFAEVTENAVTRNLDTLVNNTGYALRSAQTDLAKTNEEIRETGKMLKSYKNDEIYVAMQESSGTKTTRAATAYYNRLIRQQAKNYETARKQTVKAGEYEARMRSLEGKTSVPVSGETEEELARILSTVQSLYAQIRAHMEELFESPAYTTYEEHSMPQGKLPGFLAASARNMIIGAAVGLVLACGIWFMAGLIPEFGKGRKEEEKGKEEATK